MKRILLLLVFLSISASAATVSGRIVLKDSDGKSSENNSNVVVFIDDLQVPFNPNLVGASNTIIQKAGAFFPMVLPIMAGMEVDFPNYDSVLHNVFSLSATKVFDLGLLKKGDSSKRTKVLFENPGLVKVQCNLHSQMIAHILVLENPYYTTTNKDGFFSISNVPKGKFRLRAWHKNGEAQIKDLEVKDADAGNLSMEIIEMVKDEVRTNKWGQPYKSKY